MSAILSSAGKAGAGRVGKRVVSMAPSGDVPALTDKTWLYTGAEGPALRVHGAAMERYLAARNKAGEGRLAHAEVELRLRRRLETMLGLEAGDVALVSNASEALNIAAQVLRLAPGDNVVVNDLEYPSVVFPWLRMADRGVEVRVVQRRGWEVPTESIARAVDASTKAIAFSHVSYASGWRHDLMHISALADGVGAAFILDATQSLGVVDVPGGLADVIVASSYKWLLGGHGVGVLGWNQKRFPLREPPAVGWRSVKEIFRPDRFERYVLYDDARRFEVGYPSYPSIYLLDAGTAWLAQFSREEVQDHVLQLSGALVSGLAAQGWRVMTPSAPEHRAGNVAFSSAYGEEVAAALARERIHCWGGDGRVRASVHLYNSSDDVDRLLDALGSLEGELAQR